MPDFDPGVIILNKYEIEAFIGSGSFCDVYRAHTVSDKQFPLALKILHLVDSAQSDADAQVTHFHQEANLGMRFKHESIVLVRSLDEDKEHHQWVMVMDYASGGSLRQALIEKRKRNQPYSVEDALEIGRGIAAGLAALHAEDVVHRDLSPSNILFNHQGRPLIADLGLAQTPISAVDLSDPRPHPGTRGYCSPEHKDGRDLLRAQADVYVLGVLLFEMLTLKQYDTCKPGTRLGNLRPDVPAALDDLLASMLAENPDQRPQNGADAQNALLHLDLDGPRVSPVPPPAPRATINTLQEGLDALHAMMVAQEWQMAWETLEDLEAKFPGNVRLKLPHKQITKALDAEERDRCAAAEQAEREAAQREAVCRPGYLRRSADHIYIRLDADQEMDFICIPAGEFLMGSDPHTDMNACVPEQPQHRVHLPEYWIGRTSVTNTQFAAFVQSTGHRTAAELDGWGWIWDPQKHWVKKKGADWRHPGGSASDLSQKADHPVVQVNWHDAVAYCEWLNQLSGQDVRLPTEAEWEKAARGTAGRIYPWGDDAPDERRANFSMTIKTTTPVGWYGSLGDSPYGCADLAGNTWDWCADWYAENYYAGSPHVSPLGPADGKSRVVRGGCWDNDLRYVRSAYRGRSDPFSRDNYSGFRCLLFLTH